jgi:hypothetical protein
MVGNFPDATQSKRHTMPAKELGGGVNDNVGSVLDRPAQVGRSEGGIDRQRQAMPVCDFGDRCNVEHLKTWIAERLGKDEARFLGDGLLEVRGLAWIDQGRRDAKARQSVHEHVVRATVDASGRDDVPAGPHQRRNGQMQCCLATRSCDCSHTTLQRTDALLEHGHRRV